MSMHRAFSPAASMPVQDCLTHWGGFGVIRAVPVSYPLSQPHCKERPWSLLSHEEILRVCP